MQDNYQLHCGDSFEILKSFADETFDMIFVEMLIILQMVM